VCQHERQLEEAPAWWRLVILARLRVGERPAQQQPGAVRDGLGRVPIRQPRRPGAGDEIATLADTPGLGFPGDQIVLEADPLRYLVGLGSILAWSGERLVVRDVPPPGVHGVWQARQRSDVGVLVRERSVGGRHVGDVRARIRGRT
jgi:hypothetical protein